MPLFNDRSLLFYVTLLVAGILLSCGSQNPYEIEAYIGEKVLQVNYANKFIYILSDAGIESIALYVNEGKQEIVATSRADAGEKAWVSKQLNLDDRDLVYVTAKLAGDQTAFLISRYSKSQDQLVDIRVQDASATYVSSRSNNFMVGYFYDRIYIVSKSESFSAVKLAIDGQSTPVLKVESNFKDAVATQKIYRKKNFKIIVSAEYPNQSAEFLSLTNQDNGSTDIALKLDDIQANEFPKETPPIANNAIDELSFLNYFNEYRAKLGLSPVALSKSLTEDAAINNQKQNQIGLGHFYMGRASGQNSAWNQTSIAQVMNSWHNSSGHRRNMQGNWRCMGIHKLGPYWTQNFNNAQGCP